MTLGSRAPVATKPVKYFINTELSAHSAKWTVTFKPHEMT